MVQCAQVVLIVPRLRNLQAGFFAWDPQDPCDILGEKVPVSDGTRKETKFVAVLAGLDNKEVI